MTLTNHPALRAPLLDKEGNGAENGLGVNFLAGTSKGEQNENSTLNPNNATPLLGKVEQSYRVNEEVHSFVSLY